MAEASHAGVDGTDGGAAEGMKAATGDGSHMS